LDENELSKMDIHHDALCWLQVNCPFEPDNNIIDIWCVDLRSAKNDHFLHILSQDERQRADKYVFPKDRIRFTRTRFALRLILSQCLKCQAEEIKFHYGEKGRPELAWPEHKNLNFNLSHSEALALIAVAKNRHIGIDLNAVSEPANWQAIVKRSFSDAEQASIAALDKQHQVLGFHQIWTQKEAYTKALGLGYSYGFQNFSVLVGLNNIGLQADANNPAAPDNWTLCGISPDINHVAALAYDGSGSPQIRKWQYA